MTVFEVAMFKGVIKVKSDHMGRPSCNLNTKRKFGHTEGRQGCTHTEGKLCEDTARHRPSASPGERLHKKSNLLTP